MTISNTGEILPHYGRPFRIAYVRLAKTEVEKRMAECLDRGDALKLDALTKEESEAVEALALKADDLFAVRRQWMHIDNCIMPSDATSKRRTERVYDDVDALIAMNDPSFDFGAYGDNLIKEYGR